MLNVISAIRRGGFDISLWVAVALFAVGTLAVTTITLRIAFSVTAAALVSFGIPSGVVVLVASIAAVVAALLLK